MKKKGSLFRVLQDKSIDLPWHLRIRIAYQISGGMQLLHSRNILHRDLKSLNVLLDKEFNACISDFGLAQARELWEAMSSCRTGNGIVVGTCFWLDPNIVAKKTKHTRKTDVFSFGITLNELASRKRPHVGMVKKKYR